MAKPNPFKIKQKSCNATSKPRRTMYRHVKTKQNRVRPIPGPAKCGTTTTHHVETA